MVSGGTNHENGLWSGWRSIGGWRDARVVQPWRAPGFFRHHGASDVPDDADAGRPGWRGETIPCAFGAERVRSTVDQSVLWLVALWHGEPGGCGSVWVLGIPGISGSSAGADAIRH